MSLYLNVSNNLLQLAETLSADLRNEMLPVFQPHYIVTQTDGMNNWAKLQIANHNKIAANCVFAKPNDLINNIYFLLGGRFPNTLSTTNLIWLIYNILGEKEFNDQYRHIANYYSTDGPDRDIKRLALAEKVTDLFDQYQVYRPDMIKDWNDKAVAVTAESEWQQYIWNRSKKLSGETLPDKTIVSDFIINALNDDKLVIKLKKKIPTIYLFGLSVTTTYHLTIFNFLSEKIDIKYYLLNPAPNYYWFEDKTEKQLAVLYRKGFADNELKSNGNSLLISWGRVISDTFGLLFQNETLLNAYEQSGVSEPLTNSLLHKLQHDIFNNAPKVDRNPILLEDLKDESITINSCYTIPREVEVLYNYIVHLIDKKKELLSPRDIVVMVTDIDAYAPYIKAVFANAPYPIKFTIADESLSNGDSMINALKALLAMNKHNCKAEEVMQLLDSTFIRNRFGIKDISLIRKAIDRAGVRFGLDRKKDDDTVYVSWPYGLDRIMYGVCMSGDDEFSINGDSFYPLDIAEGSDAFELIRFAHFIQVLIESINERNYDRTIAEWVVYLEKMLQNMICEADTEVEDEYRTILSELEKLNSVSDLVTDKISFEVFSYRFLQTITSVTRTGSFAGGGITFCSLIPMRSIPFKIVALLGLNFDKFPRRENQVGFNLMDRKRMKGDRNVKDNDKHLFLETLVSAQKYLYISYIGQSVKDNTSLPPSALLDELLDYIESGCSNIENAKELIVHNHPLHSFSNLYSRSNDIFYNYLDDKANMYEVILGTEKLLKPILFDEISLADFTKFFRHPFKEYYNKVLNINYESESVLLKDTEIFELDHLHKWNLKQELLHITKEGEQTFKNKLLKTGQLPLKGMSDIAIMEVEKELGSVRKLFEQCVAGASLQTLHIEINLENSILKGTLDNVYDHKLVYVSYSKNEYKGMLQAYIQYLSARAQSEDVSVHFISAEKQEIYQGISISQEDAYTVLVEFLQLYKNGFSKILLFHPSLKIEADKVDSLEEENYKKILINCFENFKYPCEDPYLLNEYKSGFFEQDNAAYLFKSNCEKLIVPLTKLFPEYFY